MPGIPPNAIADLKNKLKGFLKGKSSKKTTDKPVEASKPVDESSKPVDTSKPVEAAPVEPTKPIETATKTEAPKPVEGESAETSKAAEVPKPVEGLTPADAIVTGDKPVDVKRTTELSPGPTSVDSTELPVEKAPEPALAAAEPIQSEPEVKKDEATPAAPAAPAGPPATTTA